MSDLLTLTQRFCPYKIADHVQEIPFDFDVERLRREMFKHILDNKFGFNPVCLNLPAGNTNYINPDDKLELIGLRPYEYRISAYINELAHEKDLLYWHPDLENSYITTLVPKLEKISGLNIGRVRLKWLMPNAGYNIHIDYEPMRLHIPLFTNSLSYFIHDHKIYRMLYGKLYHLITTNIHTAWNFGDFPRLHLIFSTYADEEFDQEVDKLAEINSKKSNFVDHIKDQGIDNYSLLQVFNITDSIEHLDSKTKVEMLHSIKQIVDILDKNK